MRLNKRSICITLAIICLLGSCTKTVTGPKGEKGEPGKKGNAIQNITMVNQLASAWTFNGSFYTSSIIVPQITDYLIASGEAKVYMQVGTKWWSLPYAVGNIFMQASFEKSLVHLKYSKIHDGPPPAPGDINFRVITTVPAQ